MNIEELEQDYKDDEKAYQQSLEELKNAIDWVSKTKTHRDKSLNNLNKAKAEQMILEARRLTVHND